MTVTDNNGTYFVVKKTGIFSFTSIVYGTGGASTPATLLDVSTVVTHSGLASTTQLASTIAVAGQSNSLYFSWTGVLPASDTNYYKVKIGTYTTTGGRLIVTYLGECPAITGFPY